MFIVYVNLNLHTVHNTSLFLTEFGNPAQLNCIDNLLFFLRTCQNRCDIPPTKIPSPDYNHRTCIEFYAYECLTIAI